MAERGVQEIIQGLQDIKIALLLGSDARKRILGIGNSLQRGEKVFFADQTYLDMCSARANLSKDGLVENECWGKLEKLLKELSALVQASRLSEDEREVVK